MVCPCKRYVQLFQQIVYSGFFFQSAAFVCGSAVLNCHFGITSYQKSALTTLYRQCALSVLCRCAQLKATPHKARLTALHAICLLIFRHIAQKFLARHKVCLRNFYAICRKIRLRILRTSFVRCYLKYSYSVNMISFMIASSISWRPLVRESVTSPFSSAYFSRSAMVALPEMMSAPMPVFQLA